MTKIALGAESHILRRMETCRHYNGWEAPRCKAGKDIPLGPLPCIRLMNNSPPSVAVRKERCDKLDCYTREEAEAYYQEGQEAMAQIMRVLAAVKPWRTWTPVNRVEKAEVIECPECKGKLHLSQSAYNGHVHGKCETAGCVSWME